MPLAHNMLTQTNWSHAPLHRIVEDALGTRAENHGRVAATGPALLLDPKGALAISMALHELLTNAIKYGALSNDTGMISVTWTVSDAPSDWFRLEWRETGGPAVAPPAHQGFRLAVDHPHSGIGPRWRGQARFSRQGVVCTIRAPVPAIRDAAL